MRWHCDLYVLSLSNDYTYAAYKHFAINTFTEPKSEKIRDIFAQASAVGSASLNMCLLRNFPYTDDVKNGTYFVGYWPGFRREDPMHWSVVVNTRTKCFFRKICLCLIHDKKERQTHKRKHK